MACLCHGGNGSWKHRPTGGCGLEGTLSSGAAPGQGPGLHGAFQGKPPCQAPPEHVATGHPGIPDLSLPLCCTQGLLLTPWDPGQQHSGPALSSAWRSPNEIPKNSRKKGEFATCYSPCSVQRVCSKPSMEQLWAAGASSVSFPSQEQTPPLHSPKTGVT